jgi:mono/diheme cytochrome c family protein
MDLRSLDRRGFRLNAVIGVLIAVSAPVSAADRPVSYNRDIRPILSDKCFACHGPDHGKREADLRLDIRDLAIKPLASDSTAIVPGKPEASELLRRVTAASPDEVMPPPHAKLGRLTPAEIDTLRRWIASGSAYQAHWAFLPLEPVPLPMPPVNVAGQHPIDRIVFTGLAEDGLSPQPEADRRTLLRRVTFDLTGLPPMPAEIEAFVADADPRAYEKVVDRLLQSPRYGERMAADWLDLARYADSYGFQVDRERDMWPWRDWVIRAFNDNLPWDQFVTWQMAGDLLPNPTDDQRLATAFNRLHAQESEGGSVEEEYRVNYINDRVVTFGTAFLGLTLECCRCHDHKFDPISQREYYQLFAFFDDIDEAGLYSYFTQSAPTPAMPLLDAAQKQQHAAALAAVKAAEEQLAALSPQRREAFAEWLKTRPVAPTTIAGEVAHYSFDEKNKDGKFASPIEPPQTATSLGENELVDSPRGKAVKLTGDHAITTTVGNFHRYDPFTISLWIQTPDVKDRAVVLHRSRAWTDAASRGYELLIEDGRLKWSLIHFWPGDAISIKATAPVPLNEWVHVTVSSDGSSRAAGLMLFVNGQPEETEIVRDHLTRDITGGGGDTIALGERFRDRGFTNGLVDDLRVFRRDLTPLEVQDVFQPGTLASVWSKDADGLADAEREALFDVYRATIDEPVRQQRDAVKTVREKQNQLADAAREIMVMQDMPTPKTAYILKRGEYNLRADAVEPTTPAALLPFPQGQPKNRLGLARWLTDPRHPLLARVTVNRFWMACFGRGLVKTVEDFGSQSERPEYPELLDWLAGEFVRTGWDAKALLKTIVMSQTYRQRSFSDPKQMADDPENVRLARGPRHRLPAEMIRDNVLAASGLLVEKSGGPPVRTYDMPESFKPSKAGTGDDLYRRSLYTFWRRTSTAPVLEAFDVPKRVVCVARRDITNTPLHAFVLLNGPQFVEAARVLAERLHRTTNGDRDRIIDGVFVALTSREPDAAERAILQRMFAEQVRWYQEHASEAALYLSVGSKPSADGIPAADLAAWTTVVSALMNYDGCVVKR